MKSNKWTSLPVALLMAAAVTACQSSSGTPAATQEPSVQNQPPAGGQQERAAEQPAPTPTPTPTPAPGEPAAKENIPPVSVKTYRMNPKTYDIVPIDPQQHSKKVVLLTFDDGPKDWEMNNALLDTLDKHKAKAIFFLNGYRIKQKPEIVKLLDERGQTIGNHSWDHIDLKKESKEKVDQQLADVQKAVKDIIGKAPAFFRPPHGSGSDIVRAKAKEENMLYMTWSNGSKDWEMSTKNHSSDQVVANVLEQLHAGSNILMHELPWTVEALDKLLTQLEEKGYGFVDPQSIELTDSAASTPTAAAP
ncbi:MULTISPECIES: polysaccharide deacetylase family protein [unclassified Paenibacillus]|uniref:polysaccharide deacetylase family protein n=1 Tax=unclassified Paenibacillus TaxID=185978 RepID=UPI0009316CF4|nr:MULTISPECIES: polysaccharide deacetylase family protein [unclassified Paenibacillus]